MQENLNDTKHTILFNGRFTIKRTNKDDQGWYECRATSNQTQIVKRAYLKIKGISYNCSIKTFSISLGFVLSFANAVTHSALSASNIWARATGTT